MLDLPPQPRAPIGFVPLSQRPTVTQIVQNIFPGAPNTASTPAQIVQALSVAGTGLARIDTFVTAGAHRTINSVPVLAVPPIPGAILVPVQWGYSKDTIVADLACVLSLQYASAAFNGFTSMSTIAGDQNNVRQGVNIGVPSVGLQVLSLAVRSPVGLGLWIIGANDLGPTSNCPARFSIIFYAYVPQP